MRKLDLLLPQKKLATLKNVKKNLTISNWLRYAKDFENWFIIAKKLYMNEMRSGCFFVGLDGGL